MIYALYDWVLYDEYEQIHISISIFLIHKNWVFVNFDYFILIFSGVSVFVGQILNA